MKKTAVIYGASGMLGSHLAIDFATRGFEVKAITHNDNVVTQEVSKFALLQNDVSDKDLAEADIVVDCGGRPGRYAADSLLGLPQYRQMKGTNTVSISSTVMFCEQTKLGVGVTPEYVMDTYRRDHYTSSMENHILRLPVVSMVGHHLSRHALIASGRRGLDYNLLRADKDALFTLTEHRDSVRDYVPVAEVAGYVLRALKHPFSYVDSGNPRTLWEQVIYLIDHGIVRKDASFRKNLQFSDNTKVSNHYSRLDWCPNVYL